MKHLLNRVAVVTGGSRGLGLAIARLYAQEGALVILAARSVPGVEAAAAGLRAEGLEVTGQACDVGEQAQVVALRDRALAEYGRLDVWVNNAGLSSPYGPTHLIPTADFERVIRTNILGTYYGSLAALDTMLPTRQGHLINLYGRGDKGPVPFQNAYASSKAWVRQFTRTLAAEHKGSGVGIHGLNPGLVQTEMLGQVDVVAGYQDRLRALPVISGLWGQPPDVAARPALALALGRGGDFQDLRPPQLLARTARFAWNRVRGKAELPELHVTVKEGRRG